MLKDFTYKVDRYGDDISVRYYLPGNPMSMGVIRATTILDGLKRKSPVITSTDVGKMIQYIVTTNNIPDEGWDKILMEIKRHSTKVITE
jgi:hypothetical protein